jgi:hypothetical protein
VRDAGATINVRHPNYVASLSPVLFDSDLPIAELYAARLDGELFALEDGFCVIDAVDSQELRARSIATQCVGRLIAEQRTAAWIWGALLVPPSRLALCANIGARARPVVYQRASVREVVVEDDELATVAGIVVTTPLRTAVDLARFATVFEASEIDITVSLMRIGRFGLSECRGELDRRNNLPNKVRAWKRLCLAAQDPTQILADRLTAGNPQSTPNRILADRLTAGYP